MSFKSDLKLNSGIFDKARRTAAGSRAVNKSSRYAERDFHKKMRNSLRTGKPVKVGGFRKRHSAQDERAQIISGKLDQSATVRQVSDTSAELTVGTDYLNHLLRLNRKVVTDEDRQGWQKNLDENCRIEIGKLL